MLIHDMSVDVFRYFREVNVDYNTLGGPQCSNCKVYYFKVSTSILDVNTHLVHSVRY